VCGVKVITPKLSMHHGSLSEVCLCCGVESPFLQQTKPFVPDVVSKFKGRLSRRVGLPAPVELIYTPPVRRRPRSSGVVWKRLSERSKYVEQIPKECLTAISTDSLLIQQKNFCTRNAAFREPADVVHFPNVRRNTKMGHWSRNSTCSSFADEGPCFSTSHTSLTMKRISNQACRSEKLSYSIQTTTTSSQSGSRSRGNKRKRCTEKDRCQKSLYDFFSRSQVFS
jgi:hypothetical protein